MSDLTAVVVQHPLLSCRQSQALVDAIVEAVDLSRYAEVERVRGALEPLGLGSAFTDELALSGRYSRIDSWTLF